MPTGAQTEQGHSGQHDGSMLTFFIFYAEMKFSNSDNRIPIKSWCLPVEDNAWKQAVNLTALPCVYHHVALMADCHSGFGMPIGGVIACIDAIIPNAVGVDIGCGMCAIRTDINAQSLSAQVIRKLLAGIRRRIPVGFAHHRTPLPWKGLDCAPDIDVVRREIDSAARQLGTLGGGNHFIEIQKDSGDGRLWIMIHSGSRNFGYTIANHYHKAAVRYCEQRKVPLPDTDLAWIPLDEEIAREYFDAMQFALDFAYENRRLMKRWCQEEAADVFPSCTFDLEVNIHHNFASQETHFGRDVIVHRKGATQARKGQWGIIPGSMGTASYIVKGLGNAESFASCSHGAGRVMGRNEANRRLNAADVRESMKGVVVYEWPVDRKGRMDVSEAPQAYKNIEEVIEAQKDLVEVMHRLEPLGVIKG